MKQFEFLPQRIMCFFLGHVWEPPVDHRRGYCDLDQFDEWHPGRTWCGPKLDWSDWHRFSKAFNNPIKKSVENSIERKLRRQVKHVLENKDFDSTPIPLRRDSAWDIC